MAPNEKITVKDALYEEFSQTISDRMQRLRESLVPAEFAQLEEVLALRAEIGEMELTATFILCLQAGSRDHEGIDRRPC
ncbi:hypothetical protein E6C60_2696 [Paenibacillus algicola]|uniref:Uncharacterized protein n=1 Tax=Paenibacillus algicola TaxID=2565926 RepID=A0A4P8XLN8_9BACL|nr:DUF6809 family protein [Paenibacillus algicola]QCT03408.1 hypothetical protein E6C60_2696 [Paenibacillus algicola]